MENLRRAVTQIANAQTQDLQNLSRFSRFCLIPFLSFSSSLYRLSLFLRHNLYLFGLFRKQRLPVRVISVGNLTWGGNGKTPMVEYIAVLLSNSGISPLVLTRGYAGGDEAKMLQRHLLSTSAKIGVGANRARTAAWFLEKYGYIDQFSTCFEKHCPGQKLSCSDAGKIGAVILDDGMQHWSLLRDLEIVMVNGMLPWGNGQLLPRGPLREPLTALRRADVVVIHHADLISDRQLRHIKATVREIKETLPILFSRMSPSHFFEVKNCYSKLPLTTVKNMVVLCVSAIGCPNAFVLGIEQIGPLCVDRLDFSDHHFFQTMDIVTIKERLKVLKDEFRVKPIIVVTEKDYDRDPVILKELDQFKVLVLCSSLQIVPSPEQMQESLNALLKKLINQAKVFTRFQLGTRVMHRLAGCNYFNQYELLMPSFSSSRQDVLVDI